MTKVTRFAGRDPGPAARVAGFMGHLRLHGFRLGVSETAAALAALTQINACDRHMVRLALKAVCAGNAEDIGSFDTLFDSYWLNQGRVREKIVPSESGATHQNTRTTAKGDGAQTGERGVAQAPDDKAEGDAYADGTGKLVAADLRNLMKKDLRELVDADDIRAAEQVAIRLGRALRDRRSRRRKAARKGRQIDFRRTIRRSLGTGGEPLHLAYRARPDRPVKIVALCDVSGSMMLYARPFLAFLAGLMRADGASDAYLFHTRLVRIADALRDPDPLRALNRVTLLADGMGGGSKIGLNLRKFAGSYARKFVNGRSVVIILSDGYDSDSPAILGAALAQLKKRGCKVIWLNPLKGWADYAPIAGGMEAAMPHLDLFSAANTLDSIAALEHHLARL